MSMQTLGVIIILMGAVDILLANIFPDKNNVYLYKLYYSILGVVIIILGVILELSIISGEVLIILAGILLVVSKVIEYKLFKLK
ncbi:hypothetical protein FC839_02835 [Clostridium botulinum]|uniref:Uncharacterized protein n=2 Tax=Clostridium botulinum TaxID=1491 RepID=A0A6B4JJ92_CLOBO|nr:hypothetical protein CLO_0848 [Clostridium botulinum E1 str. 'BoNT E Beluga']MBY6760025.1 hypothetical protein [Clostridium botulinum]MBY6918934.1 hypothetical protein [Clostridium botulinum]NFJ56735.1 hypothetical protein [Clostridium botulinum]NFL52164.1 hypothetical protein [Clostridium botulinum]